MVASVRGACSVAARHSAVDNGNSGKKNLKFCTDSTARGNKTAYARLPVGVYWQKKILLRSAVFLAASAPASLWGRAMMLEVSQTEKVNWKWRKSKSKVARSLPQIPRCRRLAVAQRWFFIIIIIIGFPVTDDSSFDFIESFIHLTFHHLLFPWHG